MLNSTVATYQLQLIHYLLKTSIFNESTGNYQLAFSWTFLNCVYFYFTKRTVLIFFVLFFKKIRISQIT